jgi:hypothetical protein
LRHSSFVQLIIIKGKPFWAVHSGKPSSAHACHGATSGLFQFFFLFLSTNTPDAEHMAWPQMLGCPNVEAPWSSSHGVVALPILLVVNLVALVLYIHYRV